MSHYKDGNKPQGLEDARVSGATPQPVAPEISEQQNRRQWGASALAAASLGLVGCGNGPTAREETLEPFSSSQLVSDPDKEIKVDLPLPTPELGKQNELLIRVRQCGNGHGYELLRKVRLCTRHKLGVVMRLSDDSEVDSINVAQRPHPDSAPPGAGGMHDFYDLFSSHPGSPIVGENKEQRFTLNKGQPQVFVTKNIQDGANLVKRCTFVNEIRPHARCVNFTYRVDPTSELGLGHCISAPDDTDFHFEC